MSLGDDAVSAITVVAHDSKEEAERWFEIVVEQCDALQENDWSEFRTKFTTAAAAEQYSAESIDEFLKHVETLTNPLGVVDEIAEEGNWDDVLATYYAAHPADGVVMHLPGEEAPEEVEEDENAFYAYLKREWDQYWNGQPETWNAFADEVVSDATAKGFPKNAQGWRDYVESAGDKVAAMSEYDLGVGQEDSAAFYDYLKATWDKRWDGKAESWDNYAAWVVHDVGEKGYPKSGAGWREYIESSDDKVKALGEYGLSIEAPAEATSGLTFDPDELMSELVDESQLAAAVESGALSFEPIEDDELELELA